MLEPRRDNGRASPRRVHVKPEIFGAAETSQVRQWIDCAGSRGPGSANHHEGCEPAGPIFGHAHRKIVQVHFLMAIRRDNADRIAADSRHVGDFAEGMMGFGGQVKGGLRGQTPDSLVAISGKSACERDNCRG